jgi:5-methyltetrahydrofolate--homocysteine methyltransferase
MVIKKREQIRTSWHYLRDFARENRRQMTEAEHLLWSQLRNRKLGGFKFRREHPIGPCIVDFACVDRALVIEVDGGIHDVRKEHDALRERVIVREGYRVIRFRNAAITANLREVLTSIAAALNTPKGTLIEQELA